MDRRVAKSVRSWVGDGTRQPVVYLSRHDFSHGESWSHPIVQSRHLRAVRPQGCRQVAGHCLNALAVADIDPLHVKAGWQTFEGHLHFRKHVFKECDFQFSANRVETAQRTERCVPLFL